MEFETGNAKTNLDREVKSRRVQLLMRPSVYAQVEAQAQNWRLSVNDTIENMCHTYVTQPIVCYVMTVTSKIAKEWLERNAVNNRKINPNRVRMYAEDMRSGNWKLTHQGIAFDADGQLIDGQHRLAAVVKSGVPVRMLIMKYRYRVQEGALLELDMGAVRTTRNIFQMSGNTDRVYLEGLPIVKAFIQHKLGHPEVKSAELLKGYIDRHRPELEKIVSWRGATRVKGMPYYVAAAALSALYWGEDQEAIRRFCQTWATNDPALSGDFNPKLVFVTKDYVRNHRRSSEVFRYCENMIRAFARGIKYPKVSTDCYPLDEMKMMVE